MWLDAQYIHWKTHLGKRRTITRETTTEQESRGREEVLAAATDLRMHWIPTLHSLMVAEGGKERMQVVLFERVSGQERVAEDAAVQNTARRRRTTNERRGLSSGTGLGPRDAGEIREIDRDPDRLRMTICPSQAPSRKKYLWIWDSSALPAPHL